MKRKNETVQDFIFQQDMELAQLGKIIELWDNEEDDIWNKRV